MFFDDYPAFYESSRTAAFPRRLDLRHQAMIEANRDILAGARVLDLASHDGRWSFAALKAGAEHVIGVEARASLVDHANRLFEQYGVPPESYQFRQGDMFRVLQEGEFDVDVVLCLGFVYHTLRYGELFRGIAEVGAEYCILDTKVFPSEEPLVRVLTNRTAVQGHAAKDDLSQGGRALAGYPSVPALEVMLDVYDFDIEEQFDWADLLATLPEPLRAVRGYATGNRVTLRCRSRRPHVVDLDN
ncbi:class I SAM-dependent methyltransferase [Nocardioides antri]|uniref:class I SAM-dependent methyltransferase n=1 Tax=Nocardioides antri TaxID=2607659 RepID=UPI00165F5FAF|nr:methyltransferase domain-containing protein [Nocardioides antri]